MKKIAFILLLLSGTLSWSQQFIVTEKSTGTKKAVAKKEHGKKSELLENKEPEAKDIAFSEEEYNKLLNYVPKSFKIDSQTKPTNRVLMGDLNSINTLELRYAYQEQLKLSEPEIKWLESEINQLAIAFFTDGKPTIIKKTGEYGNCTGRSIETEEQHKQKVTILSFCYTCPGASKYEDRFLQIFNARTEILISSKQKK